MDAGGTRGAALAFNVHELHYLESLSFRQRPDEIEAYGGIRARLAESERRFRKAGDRFGLCRTLAEEAALRVSIAFLAGEVELGTMPIPLLHVKDLLEAADKSREATGLATSTSSGIASDVRSTAVRIAIYAATCGEDDLRLDLLDIEDLVQQCLADTRAPIGSLPLKGGELEIEALRRLRGAPPPDGMDDTVFV